MQRSKQQALMFLLGAVLVGGVLGFSADRFVASKKPTRVPARVQMYDDIGIDERDELNELREHARAHAQLDVADRRQGAAGRDRSPVGAVPHR